MIADRPPPPDLPGSDAAALARIGAEVRERLDSAPHVAAIRSPLLELYAVQNFISPDEAAQLIALIDADARPSPNLRKPGTPTRRTSETCYFAAGGDVVDAINHRITDLIGQPAANGETMQGQRYRPGEYFKVHNDYFAAGQVYSDRVASEGGQRTWTTMAYLNRPEAGGQTHFPLLPLAIPPVPGVLLIWNNLGRDGHPNRASHHEALPVERGTKYILTKWFREREWRLTEESIALRR